MIPEQTKTLNPERTSMAFPNGPHILKSTSLFQNGRAHEAEASHRRKSECASQVRAVMLQAQQFKHAQRVPASGYNFKRFPLPSDSVAKESCDIYMLRQIFQCKWSVMHTNSSNYDPGPINFEVANMTQAQRQRYVSRPSLSLREWIDLPFRVLIWGKLSDWN